MNSKGDNTVAKQWNKWSKLDKIGCITYLSILITIIIGLIYFTYITEDMINMFRLTYQDIEIMTIWNYIALISMGIGFFTITIFIQEVCDKIFYPETKDELTFKIKSKEIDKTYPLKIAMLKKKELKTKLKLNRIKEEIIEKQNE